MYASPVKSRVARRVLPPIPHELDYPATRQAAVTIPSRIARDPNMHMVHLRLIIELASAGADTQWIMLPTQKFLSGVIGITQPNVCRAIKALEEARYIELKRITGQLRYVRITTPGYALEWE